MLSEEPRGPGASGGGAEAGPAPPGPRAGPRGCGRAETGGPWRCAGPPARPGPLLRNRASGGAPPHTRCPPGAPPTRCPHGGPQARRLAWVTGPQTAPQPPTVGRAFSPRLQLRARPMPGLATGASCPGGPQTRRRLSNPHPLCWSDSKVRPSPAFLSPEKSQVLFKNNPRS